MEIGTLNNKKFLITGGSGFIGTNLIDAVSEVSASILNLSRGEPRNPRHREYYFHADILDAHAVGRIVREFSPEIIVHLAAKTRYGNREDQEGFRINTEGTRNIIKAARTASSVRRLILASSNVVDRTERSAGYTYSNSKRMAESIAHAENDVHFRWCIVRPCYVWGPWFDAPFKDFFIAIAHGRYLHPGSIDSVRYAGYSGNVAFQILRLLEAPGERIHRGTFYLADYQPLSIRAWAEMISEQSGKRKPPALPELLVQLAAKSGDLLSSVGWKGFPLTSERLRNMRTNTTDIPIARTESVAASLPFTATEGVRMTLQWLKEQKAL